jgi:hypothetical protein
LKDIISRVPSLAGTPGNGKKKVGE